MPHILTVARELKRIGCFPLTILQEEKVQCTHISVAVRRRRKGGHPLVARREPEQFESTISGIRFPFVMHRGVGQRHRSNSLNYKLYTLSQYRVVETAYDVRDRRLKMVSVAQRQWFNFLNQKFARLVLVSKFWPVGVAFYCGHARISLRFRRIVITDSRFVFAVRGAGAGLDSWPRRAFGDSAVSLRAIILYEYRE
ncbi:hypothetical protein EVAR_93241_1 [Eumeta japonica]|uniref:Uncharacterized protein n=1 Tax=Eumeta variegata TaxID=151549 RepID=A0A4C1TXM2_EUMVA|nr:hypothetical protein EVAR_93241_1 [Eumeta japonica]